MSTPIPYENASSTTLPPPCPTWPVAGRPMESTSPVFDWTPVPGAVRYRVQVASTEAFDAVHYDDAMERGTALPLGSVLPDDLTTACWRVRAEAEEGDRSSWSELAHFAMPGAEREADDTSLQVDAPPVPLHPESTQEPPVDRSAVPFSWEGVPEASGYQLQVARTEDFAEPDIDLTVDQTTSLTLYDVLPEEATTYYWRLRPFFRGGDSGPWSHPVAFAVAPPTSDEEDLAPEAADPQASARAAGPVTQGRTSRMLSLTVSLIAILSFLTTIALIIFFG